MEQLRPTLFDFHGVCMTKYFTDNWDKVQNFTARPDDIVIATYPKAGVDLADQLSTSPRLIKTHLPVQYLPKSFWEQKFRIVYVARNAKDNAVSYFHFGRMNSIQPEPGDWSSFLQDFMKGREMDLPPRPELFDFHGVPMTRYFTDNWENVQKFQARPDDILIASYPKAGPDHIFRGTEMAENLNTSPRLIRTHLPVQFLPRSFWEQNCRIIYVARNAKDSVVSYFHFERMAKIYPEPGDWSSYLQRFMEGKMLFGSWYDHINDWWKKRESSSNLHYVFYEDLVEDTEQEIDKLCCYLGLSPSAEEKEMIKDKVQFDQMKTNKLVNISTLTWVDSKVSTFIRKGKVGDWKNHFTVAQNEEFDEDYKRQMKDSALQFRTEDKTISLPLHNEEF
ncbi:uncharacterized protein V6R79_015073 [Siganus canaliculatus]